VGEIEQAERGIAKQREALAMLDAVIRMFEPTGNPELIPAIRPHAKRLCFEHCQHVRPCYAAPREAGKPMMTIAVADCAIAMKGLEVTNASGHGSCARPMVLCAWWTSS
jgi:hypothetical protein